MTRALLVCHHYPPHVGGLEIVVERQARSLVERGYRVAVLTSRFGTEPDERTPPLEVVRIGCWHFFERRFFIPFPVFSPRLVLEAWRQVRQADVVHLHDVFYVSSWVAGLVALLQRKPILLTQHVAMVEHRSRFVMGVQRFVYATIGRVLFARARAIFAYNDNVRAFLTSRGVPDGRIRQLRNGIDTALFRPPVATERHDIRARHRLPADRPLVLFVGRLVEKKGFHLLLAAKDPAFDLVFVGPGDVPPDGLVPGIHWLGSLPQAQIAELFRCCDVFAFPAIGEIFTLVMQEAMSSGLPVITTDDPAYTGSIAAGNVVLCARDADSVRAAILALLHDPARLGELSRRGRELALRHFEWDANFQRLVDTYVDVLDRPREAT